MRLGDLVGFIVLLVIALSAVYGLYRISKPVSYTREEYEKRLKKGTGIAAGVMNAVMYPLQELWHPKAVAAIHVIKDMRQGYFDAQQANGDELDQTSLAVLQTAIENAPGSRSSRSRLSQWLFRFFGISGRRH